MNQIKATLLLATSTAGLVWVGIEIAGLQGAAVAFAIAVALNVRSYWFGPEIAIKRFKAKPAEPAWPPERDLINIVKLVAARAGIPAPLVYVFESKQANAFASGPHPERAILFVSDGLLSALSREELAGVVAHEVAHIRAHDTLTMAISSTLAGVVGSLAAILALTGCALYKRGGLGVIFLAILSLLSAVVLRATLSRSQEYGADREAVELCGNKQWFIDALRKLGNQRHRNSAAEMHPCFAGAFIVNPLHSGLMRRLMDTHPPIAKRIARLEAM